MHVSHEVESEEAPYPAAQSTEQAETSSTMRLFCLFTKVFTNKKNNVASLTCIVEKIGVVPDWEALLVYFLELRSITQLELTEDQGLVEGVGLRP